MSLNEKGRGERKHKDRHHDRNMEGGDKQGRGATKIFEDFDTFWVALPLKERFFLLKPNVSCMSLQSLVITDHLVRPGQHLISKRFLN